jgi:ankyrin repeat protein
MSLQERMSSHKRFCKSLHIQNRATMSFSIVHILSYFGTPQVLAKLLKTQVDLDSKDGDGRTPLSWAAERGHETVVKLLLETGRVNPNSKNGDGRTPLWYVAERGHEAVVKLLLETGRVDPNSRNGDGRTPLLWAAERGHEAVIRLLEARIR